VSGYFGNATRYHSPESQKNYGKLDRRKFRSRTGRSSACSAEAQVSQVEYWPFSV